MKRLHLIFITIKSRIDFATAPSIQFTCIGYKEMKMRQKSFHLNIVSEISLCAMGMPIVVVELCIELHLVRHCYMSFQYQMDGSKLNVFILDQGIRQDTQHDSCALRDRTRALNSGYQLGIISRGIANMSHVPVHNQVGM